MLYQILLTTFAQNHADMVPLLFFRDLDDVAAVEPVATLGGELPTDSLTKEEKKKQKKKQQKVAFCSVSFSLASMSLEQRWCVDNHKPVKWSNPKKTLS